MAIALLAGPRAQAQPPRWSEADVVRLTRARAPEVRIAAAERDRARARVAGAALPDNPSVGFTREQILGAGSRAQDVLALRVPIDLSGRRGARRALARADAIDAELEAIVVERAAIAAGLDAWVESLAAQGRVAVAEAAERILAEAERVMTAREAAGTVSGYEHSRLVLAAELARSRLAEARSTARVAGTRMALLVDPSVDSAAAEGDLLTTEAPSLAEAVALARRRRRELAVARRGLGAAGDARSAAARAWIPTVAITGGWNAERGDQTENGFVAGVEVELPVFASGQDVRAESDAAGRAARARAEAWAARVDAEVRVAHARLVAARTELQRLEGAVRPHLDALSRAVSAGYLEGERTLVELVDAQSALAEVDARRLELGVEAKRAEIELRLATGEIR